MKQVRDSIFAGLLAVKIGYVMNPVTVILCAGVTFAFGLSLFHMLGL